MKSFAQGAGLRALCVAVTLAAAGAAHAQTYQINQTYDGDDDVVLQSIALSAKQTRVTILLKNSTTEPVEVCANRSGSPDAFSLKVLDTGEVLQQTAVSGLSDCKERMDSVRPRKRKTLVLTFPPLPAGATRLQLGERGCAPNPDADMENWCFDDITLPRR